MDLPERISFAEQEEKILQLWKELNAFQTQLELSKGKPEYVFHDGPPFCTGLPHYGHILAGTIKDIVTRYATQTGHYVERRAGWDCHGLPVEYEIDKKLGVKGRDDVLAMGIDKYNGECRSIVQRYAGEWEHIISRLGRWIDFKNDYKTMEPWYMESVWWVFSQLWEKNLVYRSFKVMPYSTACNTPLSNFEANLNYKEDTVDPAVTVSFPKLDEENTHFLAWTTTPWTLPSNLALCVHPDLSYVRCKDLKSGRIYILAESRLVQLYPKLGKKGYEGGEYEIVSKCKGSELVGSKYKPLFPFFQEEYAGRAFRVVQDGYVTDDAGTGIVHQAPAFGEDDWRVCTSNAIIDKDSGRVPCPLDANGRFTAEVGDLAGLFIKEADEVIMAKLKAEERLVVKGSLTHSYPFCWRSDTPLIYRAVPSWFVRVEEIKEKLLANNDKTYWVPDNVKVGRFHNWLKDARDWAVSRNRYWGTPLPIWTNEDGSELVVISSIAQLEALSGQKVTDLHREFVDKITIPSQKKDGSVLRRVDEVFDCWFESGAMPYAQIHYPFENKDRLRMPADFIAEGLDQTRGWFYTLMVLSTALFDQPAFKNLIVNGLVLAEDGKKMSKRLKNYPDPMNVVHSYGADALRLYLIDSPVVRAEPLKFKEAGVLAVVKDIFLPWYNALRFLQQSAGRLATVEGVKQHVVEASLALSSSNAMDRWILAATQGLIKFVRNEMAAYRLYTVVPRLVAFIKGLTNWYVRLNRRRLKGAEGDADARVAISTLHGVLLDVAGLMSPFTPFLSETMYQHLKLYMPNAQAGAAVAVAAGGAAGAGSSSAVGDAASTAGTAASVHYCPIPDFQASLIDEAMEKRVAMMQAVIEAGRIAREKRKLNLKTPVRDVTLVHSDAGMLAELKGLGSYIQEELNCMEVKTSTEEGAWCSMTAVPDAAALGKRLGGDFKKIMPAIKALTSAEVSSYMQTGSITLLGHVLSGSDLTIKREPRPDVSAAYETVACAGGSLLVAVNVVLDEELRSMGTAREVCNRVQKLRKKAGLKAEDSLSIFYKVSELSEQEWAEEAARSKEEGEEAEAAGAAAEGGNTAAARSAAAQALHAAVAVNVKLMREALKLQVLPDIPACRPAHAVELGSDSDIVNGARLHLVVARETVRFHPLDGDAAIKAAVLAAAPAAAAEPSAHAAATLSGSFGSLAHSSGRPLEGAAPVNPTAVAFPSAASNASLLVATVKKALTQRDYDRLCAVTGAGMSVLNTAAGASSAAAALTLNVEGLSVQLQHGRDFFLDTGAQLAAVAASGAGEAFKAAWVQQAGTADAGRLYDNILALAQSK